MTDWEEVKQIPIAKEDFDEEQSERYQAFICCLAEILASMTDNM